MIYDLSIPEHRERFDKRSAYLKENGKKADLTEKRQNRSLNQNRYLHLILTWYGLELGYTLEEVKQDIFKRDICKAIFETVKKSRVVYRSSSKLSTLEMTTAIDMFRNHASRDLGIYLPAPNEQGLIESMEQELSRYGNRQYL